MTTAMSVNEQKPDSYVRTEKEIDALVEQRSQVQKQLYRSKREVILHIKFAEVYMAVVIKGVPKIGPGIMEGAVLWRYLDSAKFFDFLHNQTIFFSRGDRFEDRYEGAFTQSIKHAIEQSYAENKIQFTFDEFKKRLRERVFISCWHASQDDSMAMWSLYGRSSAAVAITTTVGQLRDAIKVSHLPYGISLTKVRYVKHWRDPKLKINPYSNVFAYKLKAYEFEKEVRVIIDRFHEDFDSSIIETGMPIKVCLSTLLRSIVVSPEAPPWFLHLIEGVVAKYEIDVPVRRSKLAFAPI